MASDPIRRGARLWWSYARFGVRGLLASVLVIGGWLGWLAHRARIQRGAAAEMTPVKFAGIWALPRFCYCWRIRPGRRGRRFYLLSEPHLSQVPANRPPTVIRQQYQKRGRAQIPNNLTQRILASASSIIAEAHPETTRYDTL